MITENKYTQMLFPYILYAPETVQKKYYNGCEWHTEEWYSENKGDCWFCGILFRDNSVFIYNIEILCKENDYEPQYLDITKTFDKLLKHYNIYHLCILVSAVVKRFYKESSLATNIRLYVKHDKPYRLPRLRYEITKHHSRERKFYHDTKSDAGKVWDKILFSAISEIGVAGTLARERGQRPDSLYFIYSCKVELHTRKDNIQPSESVRGGGQRRSRKLFGSFNFEKGRPIG
ncbi:MAG: hypothetical protein LBE36_13560 [Flavobacteriaceae bacterium]|nr:hypothetical protein [Flavobacteriaceae bacterium]